MKVTMFENQQVLHCYFNKLQQFGQVFDHFD